MAEKLAQDVAELSGIIKGLTEVVKQQASNQHITSKHIDDLAKQMKDVSEGSTPHQANPGHGQQRLRLPQVQLPKFKGKISDDLDRFIEQFNSLTLLPTGGGGGGIFIPHHHSISCHSETT